MAINHLQIRLVSAAFVNWITARHRPHSLFLPRRCKAPSVWGARLGGCVTGFSLLAALPCIFARLHDAGGRRDGKPAVADGVCEFEQSPIGLTLPRWPKLTNSKQTARLYPSGFRSIDGRAVRIHSGRMAFRPWFANRNRPPFPNSLPQCSAKHSGNGPPMAGRSRPTIFFLLSPFGVIFFSRSALGSSIVFSRNPHSSHSPSFAVSSFRSYALSASSLAAVDFGSIRNSYGRQ